MNLESMQEFVELARLASFSDAARHLNLSQPTLSKHVSAMEKELGCTLIDRSSRSFALTAQGQIFFETSIEILNAYARGRNRLKQERAIPEVTVGGIVEAPFISNLLWEIRDRHRDLRIAISCNKQTPLRTSLLDRRVDAFFSPLPQSVANSATDLQCTPLVSEPVAVLVAPSNPLFGRESVRLAELQEQLLVRVSDGHLAEMGWAALEELCEAAGFFPTTRTYFKSTQPFALDANEALLLPQSEAAATGKAGLASLAIADESAIFTIYLVTRKNDIFPAVHSFIDYAQEAAGRL